MFKFLWTAFLLRYSPFSIVVWKWNASIKSRDKENLMSSFDHFVNLLTFKNSLENGRKMETSWESWLFTNFSPRTHRSNYIYIYTLVDLATSSEWYKCELTSVLAAIYSCSSSHYLTSYFQNMFSKLWKQVWNWFN